MDTQLLETTARQLVREGHGILAADNSLKSTAKQFEAVGMESTEDSRRSYIEMLVTSPKASEVISGVILFEETFHLKLSTGQTFPEYLAGNGILPGIKLDQGLQDLPGFPGEKITAGLDALPVRAEEFSKAGARFVKWRNVIAIGENMPTEECIGSNTYILARYARICQDNNMVPIVEPEILLEGSHTPERAEEVAAHVYDLLFQTLRAFRVHLPGCVMKTSMVLPGNKSSIAMDANDVADRTVRVLRDHVPSELGGVVFLSGGQTTQEAFVNLNRIEQRADQLNFGVTFSYLRALQDNALHIWAKTHDAALAHEAFDDLLVKASAARNGNLDESTLASHPTHQATAASGVWEY